MNLKEINVAVNLRDNNIHVVRGIIKNDTGNQLNLKLIDGTDAFDFTGYGSIVMNLQKPDGTFIVDGEGEHLQVVDAETGRISILLSYEQAVLLTGMHFITISLYVSTETDTEEGATGAVKVTTARVNYYIEDNIDQVDDEEVTSTSQFPILDQLIAECTNINASELVRVTNETDRQSAEAIRVSNENARIAAETARADETSGIVTQARIYQEAAAGILTVMERIIHGEIEDYDSYAPVVVQSQMTAAIANALASIDGTSHVLKVKRGTEAGMEVSAGELYFATDTRKLYIGIGASEQLCINPDPESEFVISADAPQDTTKIWIDTDDGNAIKFYDYDEERWVATATATFG